MRTWATVTLAIRGLMNFRLGSIDWEACDLPEGLFLEMNFSKLLSNLKMAFAVAFNLVSKLASCLVAATVIVGAEFIFNIPDTEEIVVVVIVEEEVRVTRVLLLAVVIGSVFWLFIGRKKVTLWVNKLADQNIKVYLFRLNNIALIVGYIFLGSLRSSKQKVC